MNSGRCCMSIGHALGGTARVALAGFAVSRLTCSGEGRRGGSSASSRDRRLTDKFVGGPWTVAWRRCAPPRRAFCPTEGKHRAPLWGGRWLRAANDKLKPSEAKRALKEAVLKRVTEDEDGVMRQAMLPRKQKRLYEAMQIGIARKQAKVDEITDRKKLLVSKSPKGGKK